MIAPHKRLDTQIAAVRGDAYRTALTGLQNMSTSPCQSLKYFGVRMSKGTRIRDRDDSIAGTHSFEKWLRRRRSRTVMGHFEDVGPQITPRTNQPLFNLTLDVAGEEKDAAAEAQPQYQRLVIA